MKRTQNSYINNKNILKITSRNNLKTFPKILTNRLYELITIYCKLVILREADICM